MTEDRRDQPLSSVGDAPPNGNGHDAREAAITGLATLPGPQFDLIDYKAEAKRIGLGVGDLRQAVRRARKPIDDAANDAARAIKAKAEADAKVAKAAADTDAKAAKAEADAKTREKPAPLTGAARKAELERLADLKESDPLGYDEQRDAAAERIGCRVGTLDEVIDKIIEDRDAQRRLNNPPPLPSGPKPDTDDVKALIAEFNAKYFVLNEAGKTLIYAPRRDHQLHRDYFERVTFADFERLYLNRFVETGVSDKTGEPIFSQAAEVWLRHRDRLQYPDGMVFDPSGRQQSDGVLNLWRGFGVKPKPGSCQLFKEHLLNVICCGDTKLYEYLLNWCADAVQHPDQRGEVAIVLCGPEGTGKGIFANAMKYLFGQHGLAISNAKHLVGQFNAHLRDTVLLFADEAFYAGNPAHTPILKAIITERDLIIEAKYQNAVPSKNHLHIIMASNELWVVPATLESRRFVVLAVALSKMGNHAYFAAIEHELEHGGYEALLDDLLTRDISQVNLREIPITDALITQRKLSLPTTEAWWLDCLHKGYVFTSALGLEDDFHAWLNPVSMELLYASYERYCRAHSERHPLSRELLGAWLRKTAGCVHTQPGRSMVGEHITDATTTGNNYTSRVAEAVWKDRANAYWVHTLTRARADFLKATGLAVDWDDAPSVP